MKTTRGPVPEEGFEPVRAEGPHATRFAQLVRGARRGQVGKLRRRSESGAASLLVVPEEGFEPCSRGDLIFQRDATLRRTSTRCFELLAPPRPGWFRLMIVSRCKATAT